MNRFLKVSRAQFIADGGAEENYSDIMRPRRGTAGSAGYDFFAPCTIELGAHETIKVATGIRCEMNSDRCLMIFPRSSLGFRYRLALDNTVGIIDSDYFGADNEGHIQIKMTNHSQKPLVIEKGKAFAQGVFLIYGLTDDDGSTDSRCGGFGSTD